MDKNIFRSFAAFFALFFSFSIAASAQSSPSKFENIKIGNFGQMDENIYRGAQPAPEDFAALAALGIKTIVDLRSDPVDYAKSSAEAAGIKYVNVPMNGWMPPTDAEVAKAVAVMTDPASGKVFIHCKAGIHRTGVVGAAYRIKKYGWDFQKAYTEMQNYKFEAGLTRWPFKNYVKDYAKHNRIQAPALPMQNALTSGAN